jgi:hypothetical protein
MQTPLDPLEFVRRVRVLRKRAITYVLDGSFSALMARETHISTMQIPIYNP